MYLEYNMLFYKTNFFNVIKLEFYYYSLLPPDIITEDAKLILVKLELNQIQNKIWYCKIMLSFNTLNFHKNYKVKS